MSEYQVKEVFDKSSKPVEKILIDVFKEYCIKNLEKNNKSAAKNRKM